MSHPPCPLGDCIQGAPHEHPALGEGLWGPKVVAPVVRIDATGTLHIGQIAIPEDGPLECPCGAQWTGPLILPLKPGERRRRRLCDACIDKAEAATLARHREMFPPAQDTDVAEIRLPYREDTDL